MKKPIVYLPSTPSLSTRDLTLYKSIKRDRLDLAERLSANGYEVENIDGVRPWLKTMVEHAEQSDAFLFPPLSVPSGHPRFKSEAAQRWFEFFSLTTGILVGSREKYQRNGISKPCIIMDPRGESLEIDLLRDLHKKGMLPSQADDFIRVVRGDPANPENRDILNQQAVEALTEVIRTGAGKSKHTVRSQYPDDYFFEPQRTPGLKRHPFGTALFGSASTQEPMYRQATHQLALLIGERGWRMITGAGKHGCMGAADAGFEAGRQVFNQHYPGSEYKPAHIGISTQPILRLEGPPPHLDQLIITDNIYDRMKVMIRGQKVAEEKQRTKDAVKVIFVVPGGTGTLHEFATLMQLATNGNMMDDRQVVLLNPPSHLNPKEGFWYPLLVIAKKLGFDSLFEVAGTPEEAMTIADREYMKWVDRNPDNPEYKTLPHPHFNPHA